jgi:thimet oligopeptidase
MTVPQDRITLPILDDVTLTAAATQMIADARARMAALEALPLDGVTPETVLDQWDAASIHLENTIGPVAILNNVHPDATVRDAADAALREIASFQVEVFQNERLYARVQAVEPVTPAQRQLKKDLIEAFEDTGVTLPPERRARAKAIADLLVALDQEFSKNLRENPSRLTFTPEEAAGLPDSYLARVPRDAEGNLRLGFDYPDFNPFMANASNEEARRRYYVGYLNRGTDRNVEILDEIVTLRRELASLYDLASYAQYVTRRRMVESPAAVHRFLEEVRAVVTDRERRDLEELRALKAEMTRTPLERTRLHRWDVSYYSERLRERRYQVDQEALRRYFPVGAAIDWLLTISSRLFGVRFEEARVPVWHEEVRYFDVIDEERGERIAGIYMDLFPRTGKFTHAAAWPVRGASRRVGRTPISVLVANFDRAGLTHDEVETLFHEFGHVLHGVLSTTTYNQHAGTNVDRDFVEAPSQIYEEWSRRVDTLALMREVCPDCPVMDAALVDRLNAARRFGRGIAYARQLLYATYDLTLFGEHSVPALETWRAMEAATPLGFVDDTAFPGTFSHIAGGYGAGYYGYMWAEALALDMLSVFGPNLMNPEVGRRFREQVLARGGEDPPQLLVQRFLGRPVSSAAFFEEIAATPEGGSQRQE